MIAAQVDIPQHVQPLILQALGLGRVEMCQRGPRPEALLIALNGLIQLLNQGALQVIIKPEQTNFQHSTTFLRRY